MRTLKVVILKVVKVLACNKLYAIPRLMNTQYPWRDRTVLFRIGSRNFSFHLGSRSLKSADLQCPWCYASNDNKAFTAERWKELHDLRKALMLKSRANEDLAKANALLLMKTFGLPAPTKKEPAVVHGIDRGEGKSPRFVLDPDHKEDTPWDPEGNHHVRYYINDAHDWDKGS